MQFSSVLLQIITDQQKTYLIAGFLSNLLINRFIPGVNPSGRGAALAEPGEAGGGGGGGRGGDQVQGGRAHQGQALYYSKGLEG